MGRGKASRSPLRLEPLVTSPPPPQLTPVLVGPVGELGTFINLKDEHGDFSSFTILARALIDSSALPSLPNAYYVSSESENTLEHLVTGNTCSCLAVDCVHFQAVQALQESLAGWSARSSVHLSLPKGWQWRISPQHALSALPLTSGVAWTVGGDDRLAGYALRVGEDSGLLALNMWSDSRRFGREQFTVHDFVGPCYNCGKFCETGRLLQALVGGLPSLWDASVLRTNGMVTNVDDPTLKLHGPFGKGFSYSLRRTSLSKGDLRIPGHGYFFEAYIDDVVVAAARESVDAKHVLSNTCATPPCPHAPWRNLYERHLGSPLARLRQRMFPKKNV